MESLLSSGRASISWCVFRLPSPTECTKPHEEHCACAFEHQFDDSFNYSRAGPRFRAQRFALLSYDRDSRVCAAPYTRALLGCWSQLINDYSSQNNTPEGKQRDSCLEDTESTTPLSRFDPPPLSRKVCAIGCFFQQTHVS